MFDPKHKAPDNTTNFVETFNMVIKKLREKPIMTLLEGIRKHVVGWTIQRKEEAERWKGNFVPPMKTELQKIARESWQCDIVPNGYMTFDVTNHEGTNYTVDLNKGACVCGQWEIRDIPCKHATRCLLHFNYRLKDYTSPYYSVEMYEATYSGVMFPTPDEKFCLKF